MQKEFVRHRNRILGAGTKPDRNSELARALASAVAGEVRFDAGTRALYATGGANWRQVPIGVVIPRQMEDVTRTIEICHSFGAPIVSRGGGTALAGQTVNVAVVIDFSKYLNRVVALDPGSHRATVQPGLILDHLREAAEKHHLTFGPDPSTHDHCTLGGMIGNNSCGTHSMMAGRTSDNVEELEILTYDGLQMRVGRTSDEKARSIAAAGGRRGEIYQGLINLRESYADLIRHRFPKIPRRVSGYNLDELLPENGFNVARALVGTEGTCVTVLEAVVGLVPSPRNRSLLVLGYPDIYSAADHVPEIIQSGPIACEAIDDVLVENMRLKGMHSGDLGFLPEGHGWLLLEFGGESRMESEGRAHALLDIVRRQSKAPSSRLYNDPGQERLIWKIRESGLGATALVPGQKPTWEGWEDSAVPPERLGNYLRDFRKLLNRFGYGCSLYGHFGQGCLHTRIDFDLKTRDGIEKYHSFTSGAADLVVSYGGSLSGEHGDGQSRAVFLPKMYGDELVRAFGDFKALWDPRGMMNPHKVVSPYSNIENLRLGTDYHPPAVNTYFKYPDDNGDFPSATLRCVGVGKCRRTEGGVMCPSFMATREEMHSTRGRAHLLFEMLNGNPLRGKWQSKAVREALDLCLSCKGCKGECPVNVDMATYKAEFLAHYHKRHFRPLAAHSMGRIGLWAQVASWSPSLANFATQARGIADISKWMGGIAPERPLPVFAGETFQRWFRRRQVRNSGKRQVMLWPDTFNNYFRPEVAKAATRVLENAGLEVLIPRRTLCCGRPFYDFGLLRPAQRYLRSILKELEPNFRSGMPIVVLEPSCLSVFREEARNLFPCDLSALRLSRQSMTLSEFLINHTDYKPPEIGDRRALVQPHCHHKSVLGFDTDETLLRRAGLRYQVLEAGCCGMAGAFGFERKHYDISMKIGERALLPTVRDTDAETMILADGFSCATQIEQGARRRSLHLAQLLDNAS
jgi:FAD/FMN-containing dehydrogenase/Fe-S oxidoreductase